MSASVFCIFGCAIYKTIDLQSGKKYSTEGRSTSAGTKALHLSLTTSVARSRDALECMKV
jgi:hypothetical protein